MNQIDLQEVKISSMDINLVYRFERWGEKTELEGRIRHRKRQDLPKLTQTLMALLAAANRVFVVQRTNGGALIIEDDNGFLYCLDDAVRSHPFNITDPKNFETAPYTIRMNPTFEGNPIFPETFLHRTGRIFTLQDTSGIHRERADPFVPWEQALRARFQDLGQCANCAIRH